MRIQVQTGFIDEEAENALMETLLAERPWMLSKTFTLYTKIQDLEKFVDDCIEGNLVYAIDLETTGLNSRYDEATGLTKDKIVGVCLSKDSTHGIYVPVRHTNNAKLNIPPKLVMEQLKRLTQHCVGIYHNFKFDSEFLRYEGVVIEDPKMFEDTMLMAYIEDSGRRTKGLKELNLEILGQNMIEIRDVMPKDQKDVNFGEVDPEIAVYYAGSDAICTYGLYDHYKAKLEALDPKASNGIWFVYNLEKQTAIVTMEMERNLVRIDVPYYEDCLDRCKQYIDEIQTKIFSAVGRSVVLSEGDKSMDFDNVGSNAQLGILLFGSKECGGMGIPYPADEERNARGEYKVGSEVLEKVKEHSHLIPLILKYRELERVKGTYLENFLKNYDSNHEVKFKLNPTTADTGRYSASGGQGILADGYSGVNCQNIPANYDPNAPIDLRKGLVARPGYKFCSIDFSGEELRIATNLSKEEKWTQEFLFGTGDLHTISAQSIFGKPREDITKLERGAGKALADRERVHTPHLGWVRMDSLEEGSEVSTPSGVARVKGIYPQGLRDVFEVVTDDGGVTLADSEHLWEVGVGVLIETKDLVVGKHRIPCASVEFVSDIQLPVDPYTLGVILGDGSMKTNGLTIELNDEDSVDIIPKLVLPEGVSLKPIRKDRTKGSTGYRVSIDKVGGRNPLRRTLVKMGLEVGSHGKFIPKEYLTSSSRAQRMEILRGLLDTDGYCDPRDTRYGIEFSSVSLQLAKDVQELVWSLGGRALLSEKSTSWENPPGEKKFSVAYRVAITMPTEEAPFSSKRKAASYRSKPDLTRLIVDVRKVSTETTRCIALDDGKGLFIAGDYMVTHNTMNFLVLYGGGAGRLSQSAGIPIEVAKQGVKNFFNDLKGLSGWLKQAAVDARKRKYSVTAFGRRCQLYRYYDSPNEKDHAKADRKAGNSAIQGTGADLMKLALWRVWDYKRRNNLHEVYRIIMPIHDEILFEIQEDKMHEMVPQLSRIMRMDDILKDKLGWKVGLEVDAEYGDTFHVNRNFFREAEVDEEAIKKGARVFLEEYYKALKDAAQAKEWLATWAVDHPGVDMKAAAEKDKTLAGYMKAGDKAKQFTKSREIEPEYLQELEEGKRPFQNGKRPMEGVDEENISPISQNNDSTVFDKQNKTSILAPEAGRMEHTVPNDISVDDMQYFEYTVKKSDAIAIKQTELIWEVLKVAGKYTKGPRAHIRLKSADGRTLFITDEPLSVDGFIAMAVNYEV